MRSRQELKDEYNEFYRNDPNKWTKTDKLEFMIDAIKHYPTPKTVLDFGCGSGIALKLYGRFNPTAELYGIDLSEEAIELAEDRVPYANFTTEDEFEDIKKFDFIMCLGVAEHFEELLEGLKDLKKRLAKKGILYLEVPHNLLYCPGPNTFRRLEVGSHQVEWHLRRNKWESLLLQAGFTVLKRLKGRRPAWEFIWILS